MVARLIAGLRAFVLTGISQGGFPGVQSLLNLSGSFNLKVDAWNDRPILRW